jgi:RNA polymerase sigma-70 factor (ECF subfamily)
VSGQVNLRNELVRWIPNLRAFALTLTQNAHHSDDLVQETLVKALSRPDSFEMGTNLRAWLFTILRNSFYNDIRRMKYHSTATLDDIEPDALKLRATQEKYMEFQDVLKGLSLLVPEQREAIILIAAEGLTYEEAAEICGCPVGTMKSRLSRARRRLEAFANGKTPGPVMHGTFAEDCSVQHRIQLA